MTLATSAELVVAGFGLCALFARMVRGPGRARKPLADVRAKAVMSANELDFHKTLVAALPDMLVLAQVSFGALLEPRGPKPGTSQWWSNRNRYGQKVADWVVMTPKGEVVAIIELDDRTHDRAKDAVRDRLTASVGIATLRYMSTDKPDGTRIRRDLRLSPRPRTGLAYG